MSLIDFNKVTIGYDGKSVISDLTFQIKPNEYVCIVGENGSGKTTLMKCLLGLIPPLSGKITFGDGLTQNEIGYLPQKTVLQKDFPASVEEVVLSGCLNKKPLKKIWNLQELPIFVKTVFVNFRVVSNKGHCLQEHCVQQQNF